MSSFCLYAQRRTAEVYTIWHRRWVACCFAWRNARPFIWLHGGRMRQTDRRFLCQWRPLGRRKSRVQRRFGWLIRLL